MHPAIILAISLAAGPDGGIAVSAEGRTFTVSYQDRLAAWAALSGREHSDGELAARARDLTLEGIIEGWMALTSADAGVPSPAPERASSGGMASPSSAFRRAAASPAGWARMWTREADPGCGLGRSGRHTAAQG